MTNTTTVTTPGEREIRSERIFDAPRDEVWAAFTDPALIPEWWGPHDVETTVEAMDVRAGGQWRFVCNHGDGEVHAFRGTYREVTPPSRAVQTFEWEGMPGHVCVETVELEEVDGERTRVTTTTLFHTGEERYGMVASGAATGLTESYEKRDALFAKGR